MRDDWRPTPKRGRLIRTVRDKNGITWHYDHNRKEWVKGRWRSDAALKQVKTTVEKGNGTERGK